MISAIKSFVIPKDSSIIFSPYFAERMSATTKA
jgi:hypothetical protein